jgi:hypothetical protein
MKSFRKELLFNLQARLRPMREDLLWRVRRGGGESGYGLRSSVSEATHPEGQTLQVARWRRVSCTVPRAVTELWPDYRFRVRRPILSQKVYVSPLFTSVT